MEKNKETKVTTGTGRFSYEHLFHRQIFNGQQGKYGLSFLIPKDDGETIRKIKSAIRAAYEAGKSKLKSGDKVLPLESIDLPLRDGDVEKAIRVPVGAFTGARPESLKPLAAKGLFLHASRITIFTLQEHFRR